MQISKLNVAMMPVAKVLAVAETLREGDLRMIKKTYSENQAMVEKLWKQYQKDNNPKWLADICLNVPFFDHPEVGKEIAKLLKQINP